jgi:hypothetical protein
MTYHLAAAFAAGVGLVLEALASLACACEH